MVAPKAPGTSSGSVTATPLEVYLWFIPPGLSHDMTPKLDARRAEGNVCAHSLTIFTANFSPQKISDGSLLYFILIGGHFKL